MFLIFIQPPFSIVYRKCVILVVFALCHESRTRVYAYFSTVLGAPRPRLYTLNATFDESNVRLSDRDALNRRFDAHLFPPRDLPREVREALVVLLNLRERRELLVRKREIAKLLNQFRLRLPRQRRPFGSGARWQRFAGAAAVACFGLLPARNLFAVRTCGEVDVCIHVRDPLLDFAFSEPHRPIAYGA